MAAFTFVEAVIVIYSGVLNQKNAEKERKALKIKLIFIQKQHKNQCFFKKKSS